MRRQLLPALGMVVVFTVLTGLLYPLAVTGIAQGVFKDKANGSLVERDGTLVGASWIGQPFTEAKYFHPRPSAADYSPGPDYSYGSNYGPTNDKLLLAVEERVRTYREENGLDVATRVPVDAVTASGSGLDPHISVANARLQASRVAQARQMSIDEVNTLINQHTVRRALGFLGEPGVNVLQLNLRLDRTH